MLTVQGVPPLGGVTMLWSLGWGKQAIL